MQLQAIDRLEKLLEQGMTYEEMVRIMGRPDNPATNPTNVADGVYSYYVNFGYNCGLDIFIKNGLIEHIVQYN